MISKANRKRIDEYMNMLDKIQKEEENRAKINVYMDLCNVIVKHDGERWIIDSPDTIPAAYSTKAELMHDIEHELEIIKGIYQANGEMDELRRVYEENGMEA